MRRFLSVIMLLMGLIIGMLSVAQDVPAEDDNECYTGGLLEGQCISDWHWECGWYMRNHRDTGEVIPAWCGYTQLPPYPSAYCTLTILGYAKFEGGWWLALPVQIYADDECTQTVGLTIANNIIYAPPPYDPVALCKEALGPNVIVYPYPSTDTYYCL